MGIIVSFLLRTFGVVLFIIALPMLWLFFLAKDLIPVFFGVFVIWAAVKVLTLGRFSDSYLTCLKYPLLVALIYYTPMTYTTFNVVLGGLTLKGVFSILSIDSWNPLFIIGAIIRDTVVLVFWAAVLFVWGVIFSYVIRGIMSGLVSIWWIFTGRLDSSAIDHLCLYTEMKFYETMLTTGTMPPELFERLTKIPDINILLFADGETSQPGRECSAFDELPLISRLHIVRSLGYDVRPLTEFREYLVKRAHPIYKYFAGENPLVIDGNEYDERVPYFQKMPTTELPTRKPPPAHFADFPEFIRLREGGGV